MESFERILISILTILKRENAASKITKVSLFLLKIFNYWFLTRPNNFRFIKWVPVFGRPKILLEMEKRDEDIFGVPDDV